MASRLGKELELPKCDIVVVGGSAGSVEPMQALVRALPADFPAAVFIVLHLAPDSPSLLPQILSRAGVLPAKHAEDGEPIRPGHIFVAPPDHHLTIEDGSMRVRRGPRENRHRPAIDPLFRSAARVYDSRTVGVILSGYLDDGAAGLRAIRARGGIGIVQDPEDAEATQMPESALQYGGADYVLPKEEIGRKLAELAGKCGRSSMKKEPEKTHATNEAEANLEVSRPNEGEGVPSPFSCPECGGVLWEIKNGALVRFRCRVGHGYTMATLSEDQAHAVEAALWAAMRALEEKAALSVRLSQQTNAHGIADRFREQAQDYRDHAETIRGMLFEDEKLQDEKLA